MMMPMWSYDDATGLETRKTYADGTHVDKTCNISFRRTTRCFYQGIIFAAAANQSQFFTITYSYFACICS